MSQKLGSVVIGGGSGFVGTVLAKTLRDKGYAVTIISRKPGAYRMTWSELGMQGLPKNCKAVINVAGQNVLDPTRRWTTGFQQNVFSSRINTTKSLARVIENAKEPPEVFVTISGVGYYEPSTTKEYTEYSSGGDFDFLSRLCSEWEQASVLPDTFSSVRRVVIRSGVVLGRQGGMVQRLFPPFYLGLGGPMGSGRQFMPWIHVKDLADLFSHAIHTESVSGVLNGVAPQVIDNKTFCSAFARHLWRPSLVPLPALVVKQIFGEDRAKMMLEGQQVIPQRTLESGFQFQYPDIDSACKEFCWLVYADTEG